MKKKLVILTALTFSLMGASFASEAEATNYTSARFANQINDSAQELQVSYQELKTDVKKDTTTAVDKSKEGLEKAGSDVKSGAKKADEGIKKETHKIDEGVKNEAHKMDEGVKNEAHKMDTGMKNETKKVENKFKKCPKEKGCK